MATSDGLTRRALLGAGAGAGAMASFGALAVGADAAGALDPSTDDVALGAAQPRLTAREFPMAAPPAVPGATMAIKTSRDAVGYNSDASSSELIWVFFLGLDSAYSAGAVLCKLDIPAGARLVRIDYYGYRSVVGTQTWRLLSFDASAGQSAVVVDTVSPSATGLIQASLTGIDILVAPGTAYVGDLLFSSASNAFSSIVYQYLPAGLQFHPLTPFRAYDSRWAGFGGPLLTNASRVVAVKDAHNIDTGAVTATDVVPAGARAITYNLTITGTASFGYLSITPGDAATYNASSINWSGDGQNLANGGTVNLDADREVKVFCGTTGSTHFIVDVSGYYV